jgi:uncharacterized protein (DUF1800 family)
MRVFAYSFGLAATALVACASGAPVRPWTHPAPVVEAVAPISGEPRELLPDEQIQQALNRFGFGARPGDVEKVRAMGVDRWIALQLAPDRIDDSVANDLVSHYETLNAKTADLVEAFRQVQQARRREQMQLRAEGDTTAGKRDARREALANDPQLRDLARRSQRVVGDIQSAKLARAVVSERQLDEVMVNFWENHFSVYANKGQTRLFLASYDRDVIRPRALGKFRDLLGAVAKSPAMLFFLDNWQSAADSLHPTLASARQARRGFFGVRGIGELPRPVGAGVPAQRRPRGLNENYARELMELHTLGVDGGYTQKDVIEVARALTGWSMNPRDGDFVFRPEVHDAADKVVLGHKLAAGRGIEDGEDVLDIVARHPSTARFITTKLVRHFVSDSASPALVRECASIFMKTDGDIRETVRCIGISPEFFSRAAYRAKVKTPFEVVASALRAMNAQPDTTPRTAQLVARLGQPIFGRQTPDGWPDRADAWMNTGAILNRINFGLAVAAGRVPGASLGTWPYSTSLRGVSRPAQVDGVIKAILGDQSSTETRAILLSGDNPLIEKLASADSSGRDTADNPMPGDMSGQALRQARGAGAKNGQPRPNAASPLNRPVNLAGLAQVVGLALGSPEFQRR